MTTDYSERQICPECGCRALSWKPHCDVWLCLMMVCTYWEYDQQNQQRRAQETDCDH